MTDYTLYVIDQAAKIAAYGAIDPNAAAHIYETALEGWIVYADETGVSPELKLSIAEKLTEACPKGIL